MLARRGIGIVHALAAVAAVGLVIGAKPSENAPPPSAGKVHMPCTLRSTALLPIADPRGMGYTNNRKFVVDAQGVGWVAVRSKDRRGFNICLVRIPGPWRAGMPVEQNWLEDRDGVEVTTAPQRVASIAAGADSSIQMVWYGGTAASPDHQVRYARFNTSGAARLAEERAPFTVPGYAAVVANRPSANDLWQEHASLAIGPDGTAHVAWEARDPSRLAKDGTPKPGIAYATRTRDGRWSVNGVLGRPPYLEVDERCPSQSRPTILVDRSGVVHVLCYGSMSGVQHVLHGRIEGKKFSGWQMISPSNGDQRHVSAALDPAGGLHVAWREGVPAHGSSSAEEVAVFYASLDRDGHWRKAVRVSPVGEDASTPSVAAGDSSVSVAWVAWAPGARNSEGQVDNGFPADNATVEGRLEVATRWNDAARFEAAIVVDAGAASYPCWAVSARDEGVRPPLAWTSREPGGDVKLHLGWCEMPAR